MGLYKELFILQRGCARQQIRAFLWRLGFTAILGQQWLTAVVLHCSSSCLPVGAIFKCQRRVDTQLDERDKTDRGWSKSPGLELSLHCPCSGRGGQAPVKYYVCTWMDFEWGFVDFLQKLLQKTQWVIPFCWCWSWGRCKTSTVAAC